MLTIQNNDITRVRADVESVMFQSMVSPQMAVRCVIIKLQLGWQ